MKRCTSALALFLIGAIGAGSVNAASMSVSIGIRETGGSGPAFSNAGSTGGIEWVNKDGQTLTADGTWQQFTFTPASDTLTAFAGATADGILDVDWASLEHIRILNSDGITSPIRLWIDNVTNTDSSGSTVEGFESYATGTEVIFQEPPFSGSTSGNVLATGTSLVSNSMAYAGAQSDEVNLQFVDNDPTRWVRLTTFNTPNSAKSGNARARSGGRSADHQLLRQSARGPGTMCFHAGGARTAWLGAGRPPLGLTNCA